MVRSILAIQGLYFFLTGIWPLLSINTFQKVTGPKTDLWLVKCVGALISVIGLVLLISAWGENETLSILVLAIGSAFTLMCVDIIYVAKGRISKIYLLDAVVESALMVILFVSAFL